MAKATTAVSLSTVKGFELVEVKQLDMFSFHMMYRKKEVKFCVVIKRNLQAQITG